MSGKIKVPEGMEKESNGFLGNTNPLYDLGFRDGQFNACRWISQNPIVPTHEQAIALCETFEDKGGSRKPDYCDSIRSVAIEWQRRMFREPEPEAPEVIKDMLWEPLVGKPLNRSIELGLAKDHDADLINAYRRGQQSRNQP